MHAFNGSLLETQSNQLNAGIDAMRSELKTTTRAMPTDRSFHVSSDYFLCKDCQRIKDKIEMQFPSDR